MVYARILFLVTLPLAAYFYLFPAGPATVRRLTIIAGNAQAYWAANKDIKGAAGITSMHLRTAGQMPADYAAFLRDQRRLLGRVDPAPEADVWGTPYRLVDHGATYDIVSCGPDRDCAADLDNLTERLRKVKPRPASEGDAKLDQALKQALE